MALQKEAQTSGRKYTFHSGFPVWELDKERMLSYCSQCMKVRKARGEGTEA